MKILLIEPFYSGSHKTWADKLKEYSSHEIELITLDGKFWKWRMYGGCVTCAEKIAKLASLPDLILTTDMLDVATFRALTRKQISPAIPIVTYFHENQIAYPWQLDSEDIREKRDLHFGMMNYKTLLASDYLLFNSEYNRTSFFQGLEGILKKMPDYKHTEKSYDILSGQYGKTQVLPLGLTLPPLSESTRSAVKTKNGKGPVVLWNHRLDHDKNPIDFFNALIELKSSEIPFQLMLLGEQTKTQKKIYGKYIDQLESHILYMGYVSEEQYNSFLYSADIIPVTSLHDFFGISIAEAINAGVRPLLPKRLAYVELYKPKENPELFYEDRGDLINKLKEYCLEFNHRDNDKNNAKKDYTLLVEPYRWSRMIKIYDQLLSDLL